MYEIDLTTAHIV